MENSNPNRTRAKALFIGGTGSDAGKSLVVTGLCALAKKQGLKVAPFKAQNMSLNSYVTVTGGEMGVAQALQARACELDPDVRMNPILLKPQSDGVSDVVVMGKSRGKFSTREYYAQKTELFTHIKKAYDELAEEFDLIIMEGAGSIAEINLWEHDVVNMPMAEYAEADVLLVADIERGGAFASVYGCIDLLPDRWKKRVKGYVFNKFRGDASLLDAGIEKIEQKCGVPCKGVIPWVDTSGLVSEDSYSTSWNREVNPETRLLTIGVVQLPYGALYTDFEPFLIEEGVQVDFIKSPEELDGCDAVILPGTKSTLADLRWLKESGLFRALKEFDRPRVGVCGGMQMMGQKVSDSLGVEAELPAEEEGMGIFEHTTDFAEEKITEQKSVKETLFGQTLKGYEIHYGRTLPAQDVYGDQLCFATYLHGLFDEDAFRHAWLGYVYKRKTGEVHEFSGQWNVQRSIEKFADALPSSLHDLLGQSEKPKEYEELPNQSLQSLPLRSLREAGGLSG